MQTMRFCIMMFVHKNMSWMRFDFQKLIVGLDLDIEDTNISFNLINKDIHLMNGGVPWRGTRGKDALSFSFL